MINCRETQQDYVTLLEHKGGGVFEMPDMSNIKCKVAGRPFVASL